MPSERFDDVSDPEMLRRILFTVTLASVGLALLILGSRPGSFAQATSAHRAQYGYEVWQTERGLPQNSVQAILQTRDGYLWIGTKEGLARFDGLRFTIFDKQNTPAIAHNQIRRLFEDSTGRLWISTPGALVEFKDGRFTAFTTRDGLSSENIWSVHEDRSGSLWIATLNGLNRYREGRFTAFTTRDGLSHNGIETVLEDREGALWIGTAEGLTRFKDGEFKVYRRENGLSANAIKTLLEDRGGNLWIGTPEGLTRYANGSFDVFTTRDGLADNNIATIAEDQNGRLWIGTAAGLSEWRNGRFSSYTSKDGLPGAEVSRICEDRRGNLWIGTSGGLARFEDGRFATFPDREGITGTPILALLEDREGNLWAGSETGGLSILREKRFRTFTTREGLSANLIRSIFEDREGRLWIGAQGGALNRITTSAEQGTVITRLGPFGSDVLSICDDREGNLWIGTPEGLTRLKGGSTKTFTERDGLTDIYVRSLYEDSKGSLWIGTRRGLTKLEDGKFTAYTMLDGLASDYVGVICEGRDGSLWIGTLGGLSRLKDGEFTNYTTSSGLSSDVVISLYEDAAGSLWIGTHGGGLNRLEDGKISHYTLRDGLPDDVIYQILEDGDGRLWMSTNKGIIRIERSEMERRLDGDRAGPGFVTYGTADGMETRECSGGGHPAGWKARDGSLWFATIKGVATIDPASMRINEQQPPVAIERVVVDEETYEPGAAIDLAPGKARFEFYYTGLSFIAPQRVAFRYKLEGFDPDWIEAGMRRVASYTNIPSGRYRFRVLASNNDGVWNETGASIDIRLRPYFYETYWFYGLCLVGLSLVAWGFYRARVRRLEREFSAVLAERNRIAREIHDTLAQGFAGISVQLELVARLLERAPETAKKHLDEARKLVRDSLAEARRSVWDLRSQALEENDLPAALSETAKRLVAGTEIETEVRVSGTYRRLNRVIEDNLLRIGQEAMTNAIKHAQARRLRIDFKFEPERLRFSVRDDGRGFESGAQTARPDRSNGHFGLIGMRERAEQIGGRFSLQSKPGEGTEIIVEVPLGD